LFLLCVPMLDQLGFHYYLLTRKNQ
jgi:hypothetical protein